jgi:HEAT repeat protein
VHIFRNKESEEGSRAALNEATNGTTAAPGDGAVLQEIEHARARRDLRAIVQLLPYLPPTGSVYGDAAALALKALVEQAAPEEAASVRELARFMWQKRGLPTFDFAAFYRAELDVQVGDAFVTSLRGLAEMGTSKDVPTFLEYVHHPRAHVREAAILGLGRCDGQNQTELLVRALGDSNLRVAKAAQRYAKLYLGRRAVPKRPARPR